MPWSFYSNVGALKTGANSTGGYGTTLPASPIDGQEFTLVDSTTSPTYQWRFRYNAGSSNTDKWEFVGGSPARVAIATNETTTSLTYVDLTTAGPSFTAPRAGQYLITTQAQASNGTGGAGGWATPKIGAAATADGDGMIVSGTGGTAGPAVSGARTVQKTVAASDVIKVQYRVSGSGTASFLSRELLVQPIRVS